MPWKPARGGASPWERPRKCRADSVSREPPRAVPAGRAVPGSGSGPGSGPGSGRAGMEAVPRMPMIWLDLKEAGEFAFNAAVKKVGPGRGGTGVRGCGGDGKGRAPLGCPGKGKAALGMLGGSLEPSRGWVWGLDQDGTPLPGVTRVPAAPAGA